VDFPRWPLLVRLVNQDKWVGPKPDPLCLRPAET
jgi:hypothetical protein